MHVGGEGGDDDSLVAVAELPVKAVGDHVFAGGVALPLHVGGVRQKRQHALISQLAQPRQIHHAVVGSGVDLEVAGEYHCTHGGADGEGYRVGDGVVHVDELHGEASGLHHVTGLVGDELDLVCQPVLFQLQLNKTAGHDECGYPAVYHAVCFLISCIPVYSPLNSIIMRAWRSIIRRTSSKDGFS